MPSGPRHTRCMWAFRAYIVFHAMKHPKEYRETESWLYLMEWARLGGKKNEGPWARIDGVQASHGEPK